MRATDGGAQDASTPQRRLAQQLAFALEIDRLKQVWRQTWLSDGSRRENAAEHSWQIAVMAMLLSEHAADPQHDALHVLELLLVHDLVEIDAGDTFLYDSAAEAGKPLREQQAAERLYGMLPEDQGRRLMALWTEFEGRSTPEARFAAALDRLQPILHNFQTQGRAWQEHGVTARMVLDRSGQIAQTAPRLWQYVQELVAEAVRRGYLAE